MTTVDIPELVKGIVEYCVREGEYESGFLSPRPSFNVEASGLFDYLAEATGISKAEIGAMVDDVQAARKTERQR